MNDQTNSEAELLQHELQYDLRQRFAKIIGDNMELANNSSINNDFNEWLADLQRLYTHAYANFEKKIIKGEFKDVTYEQLLNKVLELSNRYPSSWNKQNQNRQATWEISEALRKLEMFLYVMMKLNKLFGEKPQSSGLF